MELRSGAVNGGTTLAPWDDAEPYEQLFVLITGANSGIGLATAQRLIDEFLTKRSLTSHLIIIPTTRSKTKSKDTINTLREYANNAARTNKILQSRVGQVSDIEYEWEEHAERIHLLSVQLDLCDIRGIYEVADTMCRGTLSNPPGVEGQDAQLQNMRLPRLDSIVCNAAYGGWSGCDYPHAIYSMLFEGFLDAVTQPKFKNSLPTRILNEQASYQYPAKPQLAEVFVAGVFGHYLLAHELLPLLRRPKSDDHLADPPAPTPGRIIWTSSIEAQSTSLNPSDLQSFDPKSAPYESAKRLTDVLALSATLPSVRPVASGAYLRYGDDYDETSDPPKIYLSHPGIVVSSFFPVPWYFMWAYHLAIVFARWLGSPWHTVDSYSGSLATAWLVLQDQEELDDIDAERVKWGSAVHVKPENMYVKKTEVVGWGWEGRVEGVDDQDEDDDEKEEDTGAVGHVAKSITRNKRIGRLGTAKEVTEEDLANFEEQGRELWEQMEELREEWEEILDL